MNGQPTGGGSGIQQFLTPESMLTPGVAGGLIMAITNALALNFGASRAWVGLGLSFLCGLLVLVADKSLLHKAVYYVLNSLVIFCVALGANGVGIANTARVSTISSVSLIAPAFAEATSPHTAAVCSNLSQTIDDAKKAGASDDKLLDIVRPCLKLSDDIRSSIRSNNDLREKVQGETDRTRFFAPWRF